MRTAMDEFPRDCSMWLEVFLAKFEGEGKPFEKEQWGQLLARHSVRGPLGPSIRLVE